MMTAMREISRAREMLRPKLNLYSRQICNVCMSVRQRSYVPINLPLLKKATMIGLLYSYKQKAVKQTNYSRPPITNTHCK